MEPGLREEVLAQLEWEITKEKAEADEGVAQMVGEDAHITRA